MMGIPEFLLPDSTIKHRAERLRQEVEVRLPQCVPWDPNMKWQKELNLTGHSYQPLSFFDVKSSTHDVSKSKGKQLVISPKGTFCYTEMRLPRGEILETAYGRERGTVLFDSQAVFPALHERASFERGLWKRVPWMSLTPMELFTLRPGTRLAKGVVVVAGLGLGHQLIEVSKRKQVTKLILLEQSRELVNWLLPRIRPHLQRKLDKVIIGDACKVLPTLSSIDVALVDIFPDYGGNEYRRDDLRQKCFGIKHIWAWGASSLRD